MRGEEGNRFKNGSPSPFPKHLPGSLPQRRGPPKRRAPLPSPGGMTKKTDRTAFAVRPRVVAGFGWEGVGRRLAGRNDRRPDSNAFGGWWPSHRKHPRKRKKPASHGTKGASAFSTGDRATLISCAWGAPRRTWRRYGSVHPYGLRVSCREPPGGRRDSSGAPRAGRISCSRRE